MKLFAKQFNFKIVWKSKKRQLRLKLVMRNLLFNLILKELRDLGLILFYLLNWILHHIVLKSLIIVEKLNFLVNIKRKLHKLLILMKIMDEILILIQ